MSALKKEKMRNKIYFITSSLILCFLTLSAQIIERPVYGCFLLQGGTVHTITNGSMEGDVLINEGRITAIGENLSLPGNCELIDASGKEVYPGFIDAGTKLGLSEISSVSLTRDFNEHGNITPHMQALTAINPNGVPIAVTRVEGVTTVLSAPSGGLLPGTAAVIDLFGYNPDQMYAGAKAMILEFPSSGKRGRWDRRSAEKIQEDYEQAMERLNNFWKEAVRYQEIRKTEESEVRTIAQYEAFLPVLSKEMPLFIEVNRAQDIVNAIEWAKEREVKVVLTGVAEGWRLTDEILESGFPVVTGPVLQTPSRAYDKYDRPYANAGAMHNAGIKVAIRTNETENVRNLPFNAGYAAAYGMGREQALRAVTIVPAEILGIDDELGSIEVGKKANLFISNGDPFEPRTQIEQVFIRGWKIPMESRHTQLYDQFLERTPGAQMND